VSEPFGSTVPDTVAVVVLVAEAPIVVTVGRVADPALDSPPIRLPFFAAASLRVGEEFSGDEPASLPSPPVFELAAPPALAPDPLPADDEFEEDVTVAEDEAGQPRCRSEASWSFASVRAVVSDWTAVSAASKVAALLGVAMASALDKALSSAATLSSALCRLWWSAVSCAAATPLGIETVKLPS